MRCDLSSAYGRAGAATTAVLAATIGASAQFESAFTPLRDIDWEGGGKGGGHTWGTLKLLGVEREEVPPDS